MTTKIQRARRIGGIAIGAIKAIFRTGQTWGATRTRIRAARRPRPTVSTGAAMAVGAAAGAAGAYFLDPQQGKRRRHVAFDRLMALVRRGKAEGGRKARYAAGVAKGTAYQAAGAGDGAESLPDPDLANKVRTEIFRTPDAPKGDVNVNSENGIIYLRGEVKSPEEVERLAEDARRVTGVRDVVNLLHPPGQPAPTEETAAAPRR
jgi:BON domain